MKINLKYFKVQIITKNNNSKMLTGKNITTQICTL